MNKYEAAAIRRQLALDYLAEHPASDAAGVAGYLNGAGQKISMSCMYGVLRSMVVLGEVASHGTGKGITYTALASITTPASEQRDKAMDKRSEACRLAAKPRAKRTGPGIYRHSIDVDEKGNVRAPIKNQGGQGALRNVVSVGSSAEWI